MIPSLAEMRTAVHRVVHGRIDRRFRARFDTSDIAQEVALRAWLNLESKAEGPSHGWLRVVAKRYSAKLHTFHSAQRRSVHVEESSQGDVRGSEHSAEQRAMTREQVECMFAAMVRLPSTTRKILHLHFAENQSLSSISRELDLPEHRVRRQFHCALKQLRAELRDTGAAHVAGCGDGAT